MESEIATANRKGFGYENERVNENENVLDINTQIDKRRCCVHAISSYTSMYRLAYICMYDMLVYVCV